MQHGVAKPGSGLPRARLSFSLALHGLVQCDSQLNLAWLGLAQSVLASAVKIRPIWPGDRESIFAFNYFDYSCKNTEPNQIVPCGPKVGNSDQVGLDSSQPD